MKYILFTLAAIFFIFSAVRFFIKNHQNQEHTEGTKLTTVRLSKSLIDVGERKAHSDVKASYVIYNTGSGDLYIQSVVPDCHCTVADYSTKPIPPNDSSIITLKYDAANPGPFQSSAVMTSNCSSSPTLLIFRGSIEQ
jgi:uncharacterized protein DUF1573